MSFSRGFASSSRTPAAAPWLCVVAAAQLASALGAESPRDAYVEQWSRRSWQAKDGLPDGAVVGIDQLPDGAMLIGTTGGTVRFDGVRMMPIANGTATIARGTLPRIEAVAMSRCVAADGSEWVGYAHGEVQRFVAGQADTLGESEGVTPAKPAHVVTDSHGTIWLAQSGQLAEFRDERFEKVADLPAGTVKVAVAAARDGGLWIKVDEPLYFHSKETGLTERARQSTGGVSTLFEDSARRLWLGTDRNGVHVLTGTTVRQVPTVGSRVHAITEDREGGIWVGTSTALNRLWPSVAWRCATGGTKPIHRLCTDASGAVWGSTLQGDVGRIVMNKRDSESRTQPIRFFTAADGWTGGPAESLCADRDGGIWIGCRDGTIHRFIQGRFESFATPPTAAGTADPVIRDIVVSRTGNVWVGRRSGVLRRGVGAASWAAIKLPALPGVPSGAWGPINLLAEDAGDFVWAATVRGELFRISEDGSQATRMTPPQLGGGATITAICPLDDGTIWIAARDVGLFRFRGDAVHHVSSDHGLPSTCVLAMAADTAGRLWCVCNRRVFAVSLDELDRVADGGQAFCHPWMLSGADDNAFLDAIGDPQCDATLGGDGLVWITLASGLGICSPDRLPISSSASIVEVEEIRVDGRVVAAAADLNGPRPQPARIVIPPDPRTIEILYAPRTFAAPTNLVVERWLGGVDREWVRGGPRHMATYTELGAGHYPLQLRSSNERDQWMESRDAVVLDIQPLLWERTWFRVATVASAAALAAIAALAFASARNRLKMETLRRQAEVEAERVRIARDMHDELGTSLTQIALLADLARGDSPDGDAAHLGNVVRISRELVRSMDELVWTVTPSNDTLPHLVSYIGQSASDTLGQFGIACRTRAPDDVPDRPASADLRRNVLMVVKEALSNIVEHAGAEAVEITIDVRDGRLALTITDDGRGIGGSSSERGSRRTGNGLGNMRRRITDLGGTCDIRDAVPHGTVIDVMLPLSSPEKDFR